MRWGHSGLGIATVALLAACGGTSHPRAASTPVSPSGRIGPLHVGRSTRADVVKAFGSPAAENTGKYVGGAPFHALGYGCKGKVAADKEGIPKCRTVFYLVRRTGRLAILYTMSGGFEYRGVHPGTPAPTAVQRLHRRPLTGCYDGYRFDTKTGSLVLWMLGRHRLHVGFLVVDGRNDDLGVLDCIDS